MGEDFKCAFTCFLLQVQISFTVLLVQLWGTYRIRRDSTLTSSIDTVFYAQTYLNGVFHVALFNEVQYDQRIPERWSIHSFFASPTHFRKAQIIYLSVTLPSLLACECDQHKKKGIFPSTTKCRILLSRITCHCLSQWISKEQISK